MKAEIVRHEYTDPGVNSELLLTVRLPKHINREHVLEVSVSLKSPGERLHTLFLEGRMRVTPGAIVYSWAEQNEAAHAGWEELARTLGFK